MGSTLWRGGWAVGHLPAGCSRRTSLRGRFERPVTVAQHLVSAPAQGSVAFAGRQDQGLSGPAR